MSQHDDDTVLHQDEIEDVAADVVADVAEDVNADLSTQVHIPNAATLTGGEPPTETEHNALAAKVNLILGVLRDASLIPSS